MADNLITLAAYVVGGGGLLGGLYALLKLRPEAGQITVTAAQGAVIVQTGVIETLQNEIRRQGEHLAEVEMENLTREQELNACNKTINILNQQIVEAQQSIAFLQKDLERHAKIADIARRKSHVAVHAIGGYEILVDNLMDEMRQHSVAVPPMLRPHKLRAAFHTEMQKIERMEAVVVEQSIMEDEQSGDNTLSGGNGAESSH